MKYNELSVKKSKRSKRVGRGISAGGGMTAGRGTKGQGARKSGGVRPGFEGGQMPLYMRIPKLRGFKSLRAKPEIVYTSQIDKLKPTKIDSTILFEQGLISSPHIHVRLLFDGKLESKKEIKLVHASSSAIAAVGEAGGSFSAVDRLPRPSKKTSDES
jgi:large subunit ribosomal protein L15